MTRRRQRFDTRRLKEQLLGRWDTVYRELLPSKRFKGRGSWKSTTCLFHEDRNPSFSIGVEHGGWRCHAGCGSGDAFSFVMKLESCTFPTAVKHVMQIAGENQWERASRIWPMRRACPKNS